MALNGVKYMKKSILFSIMLFSSVIQCSDSAVTLDEVKEKWVSWSDSLVATERDKFLEIYRLDASYLGDSETIRQLKSNSDQKAEKLLLRYSSSN